MKLNRGFFKAVALLLFTAPWASQAATSWQNLMNYQGRLTDSSGNAVSDAPYSITFNIYSVANGGTSLWSETQVVNVTKGLFNAVLGSVNSLSVLGTANFAGDLWIGLTVAADSEMTPRQQLLPAVYARTAQTLQGLSPDNTPNNLVVLDGSGKVPAGLLTNPVLALPYDAVGSQATYNFNVNNGSASSAALGLKVSASNGINSQATDAGGYGIWGQAAAVDNATAVGVRANAVNGIGLLVQSVNSNGISVTTQSSSKAALYSSATFPSRFIVNTNTANNMAVNGSTVVGDLVANLVDRGAKAGVFVSTTAASTYGVSATAGAGTGIYGLTASGNAADFGVWGNNTGNVAAGIGVEGTAFMGVQGVTNQNGGRGVEGDVPSTLSNAVGVRGTNASSSGTAVQGVHSGTGPGFGVRGGSVNGAGAIAVYGSVSATGGSIGVQGFASAVDGYGVYGKNASLAAGVGVRGEGNQGVYGLSNGDCGVCAVNVNGGAGAGLSASSPVLAISAQSTSTVVLGTGISATVQSTATGSSAGAFSAFGGSGATYGVYALNNSGAAGYAIYATGGLHAVHAHSANAGINFYSDESAGPAYGFYHSDSGAPAGGVAVYASENCSTCYAGIFSNLAGVNDTGAALLINGRLSMPQAAGTITVAQNATSAQINNNYITPNSLIFLTVATQTSVVAAVTSKINNQATITFSGPLPAITTYQYLIIGQ